MMKQLCIIGHDYSGGNIVAGTEGQFNLEGEAFRFGFVETEAPAFDANAPEMANHVYLRVTAFSCNYRDRAFILRMRNPRFRKSYFGIGSDFCGEVLAVGRNVTAFKRGDRVIANGAYPDSGVDGVMPGIPTNQGSREIQILHQCKLVRIPDTMPNSVAGGFTIGGQTAYSMARRLALQPGENVLVTGAKSNTSIFAISALQNYGVNVFALSRSRVHADKLKELGVIELIVADSSEPGWSRKGELGARVRDLGGFDAMVDPFSDVHLSEIPNVLGMGGRHITCGIVDQHTHVIGQAPIAAPVDASRLMGSMLAHNISIIGNCLGSTTDLEDAIDDFAAGNLKVPIYAHLDPTNTFGFFEKTYNDKARFGKIVMDYKDSNATAANSAEIFEPA